MPKFTETQKNSIHALLLDKGEELFIKHGLKKVSIDDITLATGISHGAFYGFYKNKEHLFMSINIRNQKNIFDVIHSQIEEADCGDKHQLTLMIITKTFELFSQDKLITQINQDVWRRLSQKLPDAVLNENIDLDTQIIHELVKADVEFNYDIETVVKMIQALFLSSMPLIEIGENNIVQLLFEAVVDKIIKNEALGYFNHKTS